MKQNVGTVDRIIRIVIASGIGILYAEHAIEGAPAIVLMVLAGVFLLTGFVGTCPLYLPFGISTNKEK